MKHCIICGSEATFCIRNTSGYYCDDCAKENFSDIELLEKISEQAVSFKENITKEI